MRAGEVISFGLRLGQHLVVMPRNGESARTVALELTSVSQRDTFVDSLGTLRASIRERFPLVLPRTVFSCRWLASAR
jgi:hypothetical protein